jgi:hypothetical protein
VWGPARCSRPPAKLRQPPAPAPSPKVLVRASGLPALLDEIEARAEHARARPPRRGGRGGARANEEEEAVGDFYYGSPAEAGGLDPSEENRAAGRLRRRYSNLAELAALAPRAAAAPGGGGGGLFDEPEAAGTGSGGQPEVGLDALRRFGDYANLSSSEDADRSVPKVGLWGLAGRGLWSLVWACAVL